MSAESHTAAGSDEPWGTDSRIETLTQQLQSIRTDMLEFERANQVRLDKVLPEWKWSARNLLHYLVLRRKDMRPLQEELAQLGLSSLGRCEAFVLFNLDSVLQWLFERRNSCVARNESTRAPCDFAQGKFLLRENTQRLFHCDSTDEPLIMVTMPTEAALDSTLIRDLVAAGMRVMRINCAHDDRRTWLDMVNRLRAAETELGCSVQIIMDIAGPKIRTTGLEEGPRIVRVKPKKDIYGRVVENGKICIVLNKSREISQRDNAVIECNELWCQSLLVEDELRLKDTSGRRRRIQITEVSKYEAIGVVDKSVRISPSTRVSCFRKIDGRWRRISGGTFSDIPPIEARLLIQPKDLLRMIGDVEIDSRDAEGQVEQRRPKRIGCTCPEVFRDVKIGERVLLDDGKIGGVVLEASSRELLVKITRARQSGQSLKSDKGINFPDSRLRLPALTEKDIDDLQTVAECSDMVAYSFVKNVEDLRQLASEIHRLGRQDLKVVLKIENQQAFENLPLLLVEAMTLFRAFGVMIARGDLAVECGWERLAELQEEVLWMCEAAHVPVIWATQVLEGLMQNGIPTRAEVSDAGLAARAECVMLNKGPYVVEAVQVLNDIMRRMKQHQVKKRATFRQLRVVEKMWNEPT